MTLHSMTYDLFQYAEDLRKEGVSEAVVKTHIKHSKAQTEEILDIIDDSLATKRDIKELELKIENVRAELKKDVMVMGYKTILGLGSMIVVGVTILGFLIKH